MQGPSQQFRLLGVNFHLLGVATHFGGNQTQHHESDNEENKLLLGGRNGQRDILAIVKDARTFLDFKVQICMQ